MGAHCCTPVFRALGVTQSGKLSSGRSGQFILHKDFHVLMLPLTFQNDSDFIDYAHDQEQERELASALEPVRPL